MAVTPPPVTPAARPEPRPAAAVPAAAVPAATVPAAPAAATVTATEATDPATSDPAALDRLARQLYGRLRGHLAAELLGDRERAQLLTDL